MTSFANADGMQITQALIAAINENKQKLSDIDGLIGDGDHGVNMSKGFTKAGDELAGQTANLSDSFRVLSANLMEIGGAMGPLYGSIFRAMSRTAKDCEQIDAPTFSEMLNAALCKVQELGDAKPGDKTLFDCLEPAVRAFDAALAQGKDFAAALDDLKAAAEQGRDATQDMVAQKGRASRLGERSRGIPDAGATSCCLILTTMADSIRQLLE